MNKKIALFLVLCVIFAFAHYQKSEVYDLAVGAVTGSLERLNPKDACGFALRDGRHVKEKLSSMTHTQRLDKKSCFIVQSLPRGKHPVGDYIIQVVNIEKMPGGVVLFARVWDEKKEQIGFGEDGTVDIERFKIHMNDTSRNSDVSWAIVEDPNGPITVDTSYRDLDGTVIKRVTNYREDPRQAFLDFIENVLNGKQLKFSSENIVAGKIGNTTSSFTSGSGDGRVANVNTVWSTVRSAATGNAAETTANDEWIFLGDKAGSDFILNTHWLPFDTSSIPATDNVSSSTLLITQTNAGSGNRVASLIQTTQPSNSALTTADFDTRGGLSSISEGTDTRVTLDTNGKQHQISLNATGRSWIKKSGESSSCGATAGWTCLGVRGGFDIDNTTPTVRNYSRLTFSEYPTASQRPTLIVEHAATAAGGGVKADDDVIIF